MKSEFHLQEQEIPSGFQIYEERLDVAGISHRKKEAASFVNGKNQKLLFEREPANKFDKNAIKLLGCTKGFFGTKKFHIGYVPSSVAKNMVKFGLSEFQPRLLKTYEGSSGFVEILFQVLGPKGRKKEYEQS